MIFEVDINGKRWACDTAAPIDLSIPVNCQQPSGAKAWYIDPPSKSPVRLGNWVGSVAQGGSVNFNDLKVNPHAHGTHTESLGHISPEEDPVEGLFDQFFFEALVVSVVPDSAPTGRAISAAALSQSIESALPSFWSKGPRALVVRTLPNPRSKRIQNYDQKGWSYLSAEAARLLADMGVTHLLIDTPSVDPEKDQGALLAHKAFWRWPEDPRKKATITEFIYVPDQVVDGPYLLELQLAAIVNDATFSRPLLYGLESL